MNLNNCTDYETIIGIVRSAVNLICYAVPVIIIVLTVIDVAKVATAGNVDDKLKKETGQKVVTRLIYAVVIFLVPTIVSLLFRIVSSASSNAVNINSDGNGCQCSLIDIYLNNCTKDVQKSRKCQADCAKLSGDNQKQCYNYCVNSGG